MNFSEKLSDLLKNNNMTQADLCRKTGIASSLMANYVSGKKSPALSNAISIAEAFNISLDELVGRDLNINNADEMQGDYMANLELSKKLKQARVNAGFTQKDIFTRLEIPQSTFSSWETGKSEPDAETLIKLCNWYGIDNIAYFDFDSGSTNTEKRADATDVTEEKEGSLNISGKNKDTDSNGQVFSDEFIKLAFQIEALSDEDKDDLYKVLEIFLKTRNNKTNNISQILKF